MTLYLEGQLSEKFIQDYVIKALIVKIHSFASESNLTRINEFLKDKYKIDVMTILKEMSFSINKYNNTRTVSINNNTYDEKSQEKIISLLKLIEYGNLRVKGLHIIDRAFKYIKSHINELYKLYIMKGGR